MLIPSRRHNDDDLELWKEIENADGIQYRPWIEKRSIQTIHDFAKSHRGYVGVSWGKDSVVVAHLCFKAGINWPLIWVKVSGKYNPDCHSVRDAFLAKFDMDYVEIETSTNRSTGRLQAGFRDAANRFGGHYISGVRAEESSVRKISMMKLGKNTKNTSRPIGWWLTQDVFSYLHVHNLPVHPVYAMLGGGRWNRDRLRVASIGGERGNGIGRAEWEREYYGDILNRIDAQKI